MNLLLFEVLPFSRSPFSLMLKNLSKCIKTGRYDSFCPKIVGRLHCCGFCLESWPKFGQVQVRTDRDRSRDTVHNGSKVYKLVWFILKAVKIIACLIFKAFLHANPKLCSELRMWQKKFHIRLDFAYNLSNYS